MHWHALGAARAADAAARLPFRILHAGRAHRAGSVARAHLAALRRWPRELSIDDAGVTLRVADGQRTAFFEMANRALRGEGLIVAWRDEIYPLHSLDDETLLATFERAASRFWGT